MESKKPAFKDMQSNQKCAKIFVAVWSFIYWIAAILGILFCFLISTACKALLLSQWLPDVLLLACIPIAMIISAQKMRSSYRKGKYLKMYLYWTLPLLTAIPVIIYNSLA